MDVDSWLILHYFILSIPIANHFQSISIKFLNYLVRYLFIYWETLFPHYIYGTVKKSLSFKTPIQRASDFNFMPSLTKKKPLEIDSMKAAYFQLNTAWTALLNFTHEEYLKIIAKDSGDDDKWQRSLFKICFWFFNPSIIFIIVHEIS